MIRHAIKATPWWVLGAAAALIAILLRAVEQWPYTVWPLQGIAVGLLAATATWAFDEPAAAVVDSLPRDLAWRTAARTVGVVALLVWWVAIVQWTEQAYFGHPWSVTWQGFAGVLAAIAYVTWRRRQGVANPARSTAPAVVALVTFAALSRPFEDRLPIFPYTAADSWSTSTLMWSIAALGSLVWLARTIGRP